MSSSKPRDSSRPRNFALLLYPQEDTTHARAMDVLSGINSVWIVHDSDRLDDGSVKKAHTHVVLRLADGCTISALANRLGIADNYIQPCRNLRQAYRYLLHLDDTDKYQYTEDRLLGPLADVVRAEIAKASAPTEDELGLRLLDYIDGYDDWLSMSVLIRWALSNGCYSVLRRGATLYRQAVVEHNVVMEQQYNRSVEPVEITNARFGGYVLGAGDRRCDNYKE